MNSLQSYFLKNYKVALISLFVIMFWGSLLLLLRKDVGGKTIHIIISIIAAFYSFKNLKSHVYSKYAEGILIGLSIILFSTVLNHLYHAIYSNSQFDFMCFYLQGQLGVNKLPFYDPDSFKVVIENMNYPIVFEKQIKSEILDVGFLSPPNTMLFFAPLASLDYSTSRTIFSILVFLFIFINSFYANLMFLKAGKTIFSFLFIFIIIVLMPATSSTIEYVQTNFFLLFFLLLTFHNIDKPSSGVFLALSTIIKPISGILFIFFLFNNRWKSALYFLITIVILLVLTSYFWGINNIIDFFLSPPANRLPHSLYGDEEINQSLLAILNRNLSNYGFSFPTIKDIYYVISIIFTLITGIVSRNVGKSNLKFAFLLYFPLMLIIYPSSLSYYTVFLLPVVFYLLLHQNGEKFLWVIIIPALGFINNESFYSSVFIWLMLLYIGVGYFRAADKNIFIHGLARLNLNETGKQI